MTAEARNIRWFARLRLGDVLLVGGKNASPGEMYAALGEAGVQVPNGFALTLEQRLRPFKVALSVGVMKMARSDMASSGVIFTLDTKSGFRDAVFVGAHSVRSSSHCGWRTGMSGPRRDQVMTEAARSRFCIDDADSVPMDIEWAKDAADGKLYIVQARPETVASRRSGEVFENYALTGSDKVLVSGKAVGERMGSGVVRVIAGAPDLKELRAGSPAKCLWQVRPALTGSR